LVKKTDRHEDDGEASAKGGRADESLQDPYLQLLEMISDSF